jgi:hypothetical protein
MRSTSLVATSWNDGCLLSVEKNWSEGGGREVLVEGRMAPSSRTLVLPEWRKNWVPSLTRRHPSLSSRPPATRDATTTTTSGNKKEIKMFNHTRLEIEMDSEDEPINHDDHN